MLTVVTGPPCSGKTTYVREHRRAGDITIDFDDLAVALGCASPHGYRQRDHHWIVSVAARNAAIAAAIGCHHRGAGVWIVDSSPPAGRQRQYQVAGAEIVSLTAMPEELHRRADADHRPPEWHQKIDDFVARHDTGGSVRSVTSLADPEHSARTRW